MLKGHISATLGVEQFGRCDQSQGTLTKTILTDAMDEKSKYRFAKIAITPRSNHLDGPE